MTLIIKSDPYLSLRLETSTVYKCSIVYACVQITSRTTLKLWHSFRLLTFLVLLRFFVKDQYFIVYSQGYI